jgi:hypothetical protein
MDQQLNTAIEHAENAICIRVERWCTMKLYTLLIGVSNKDADDLRKKLREVVLEVEQKKNWKTEGNRYTMFVIDGQNRIPV